jgi:hypothetical protein
LKAAAGAMIIDTTRLDADGVFAMACSHIDNQREQ